MLYRIILLHTKLVETRSVKESVREKSISIVTEGNLGVGVPQMINHRRKSARNRGHVGAFARKQLFASASGCYATASCGFRHI